jgi:hypothetical protein
MTYFYGTFSHHQDAVRTEYKIGTKEQLKKDVPNEGKYIKMKLMAVQITKSLVRNGLERKGINRAVYSSFPVRSYELVRGD